MVQEKIHAFNMIAEGKDWLNDTDNQRFVVKTSRLVAAGFLPGDELIVDKLALPVTGAIVLLELDGKLLVRKLAQQQHAWQLVPLLTHLAAFEWPFHQPLPLVGVVKKIIRVV